MVFFCTQRYHYIYQGYVQVSCIIKVGRFVIVCPLLAHIHMILVLALMIFYRHV